VAGEYSIVLRLRTAGFASFLVATKEFAVTDGPPIEALSDGAITGLYFNPNDDGHYVSILQTDFNTLVIWNTFDDAGHLRWVYGVGQLQDGTAVIAETYINESAGFSNGELEGFEAVPWGTMEIRMDSCHLGTFSYDSTLPEYGSGEFPIERLAFSKQIGCEEID